MESQSTFGPKYKISSYKTCSSYKRRKVNQDPSLATDDAASCNGGVAMSLLERLRKRLVVVVCKTEEEKSQKMRLILEHWLEFPSKLRPKILAAAALQADGRPTASPQGFLSDVFEAAKAFLLGRYISKMPKNKRCPWKFSEWQGLDSTVDKEDEVELTIRFFPSLFYQTLTAHFGERIVPEMMLLTSEKAVAFVPLFLELGYELGELPFAPFHHSLFKFLLVPNRKTLVKNTQIDNICAGALIGTGKKASVELGNACLSVLARLREMGRVKTDHERKLISWLIDEVYIEKDLDLGQSFVETRLRFLIEGNPSLLRSYIDGMGILGYFVGSCPFWMFELLFELGISHFPADFGFLFQEPRGWYPLSPFHYACRQYGETETERVLKNIIHVVVSTRSSTIEQGTGTMLHSLVVGAASNPACPIGMIHALVCFDPTRLVALALARRSRLVTSALERRSR